MGRAKSNTKRRPKGKRGWRKIDTPSLLNPTIRLSLEEEKLKISKSRDSQLWSEDTKPRLPKTKRTKKQLKESAKRHLLYRGFKINSTNANKILNDQIKSFNKKQRFFQWKQSQKPINTNPPKQSTILKFKNKTKKKIKLKNHKNMTLNKKNIANTIDFHKNNPYNLYKIKHNSTNSKHLKMKDLWDNNHKKSAHSSKTFNPIPMIKHQKKASKSHMISGCGIPNKFVSKSNVISFPNPGESINPLKHQYYYSKWKSLQLKTKQIFKKYYQKKSTRQWYKKTHEKTDERIDKILQKLKNEANEMKMLHLKHLRLLKTEQRNIYVKNNKNNGFEREISDFDKMKDVKSNRKLKLVKRRMRLASRMGHRIYGTKYRFKQRVTRNQKEYKIGNCLRSTLHSGTDHPLSFMFNEMQKQNKIHGNRRHRFIFPKVKAFLGPRYKVQTRIGKLHHANVGDKFWDGVDD